MESPIIHIYTICKNEIEILPFFLSYYEKLADKIVVFDNQSTDGSQEYIKQHPKCRLIEFGTNNQLRDDIHMLIKNSAWKESRGVADWVIVSDIDEFLFHKNLKKQLRSCRQQGVTIPSVVGFNMLSEDYPQQGRLITEQIKYGAYSKQFSKQIIFDPNKITEIHYSAGGHTIDPQGEVSVGGAGFKLLHYKYIGNPQRIRSRWEEMGRSLSSVNIKNKWAVERMNAEVALKRFDYVKQHAELVIDHSFFEWRSKLNRLFRKREEKTLC